MATATTTDRLPASIGQRLAWIAARVPGRSAIVEGDAQVSYAQLDSRATAIARCILAAPATGPDSSRGVRAIGACAPEAARIRSDL